MARRTKVEAEATRSHILDTAELVFERRGVSGTSLHEIAEAAGLSRGAIYWHFQDKADLFNKLMERATIPLEESGAVCDPKASGITLAHVRSGFVDVLKRVVADPRRRRMFGIATHKAEYVDELSALRERHRGVRNACLVNVERTLKQAMRRGELSRRLPARSAAVGLYALLDGLLQSWIVDPAGFDLVEVGQEVLDAYLSSLEAAPSLPTRSGI